LTTVSAKFNPELESLRGAAAFAVLMTHCIAVFSIDEKAAFWSLAWSDHTATTLALHVTSAVFNAGGAVVLFFILSGYVLTLSVNRIRSLNVAAYATKRLFRLLPPMWLSILFFAGVVSEPPTGDDGYSAWFRAVFQPTTGLDVARNFVMVAFKANPVTWTMYVEVLGSALVLLSVLAHDRTGAWAGCVLLVVYGALLFTLYPSTTFSYLACFQAGAMLALNPLPRSGAVPALACGLLIITSERLIPITGPSSVIANTAGGALIIYAVINGAARSMLRTRPLRFIGKISYSLYLFHLPVIYLAALWVSSLDLEQTASLLLVPALAIPVSILLAAIAYKLIERPAIRAGRALASRMSGPSR
jgi:peptidoglycan/LPS O-acetylase OafA/YrhL